MEITTSREKTYIVGSDKNHTKCREFEFNIKKDEKPISFYGVIDYKKGRVIKYNI